MVSLSLCLFIVFVILLCIIYLTSLDNIKNSHGTTNALPPYYVCSPSAPPFIPRSPMKTSPSHYPHLYHETYPQMAHMLPSGAPVYSGDFLKPPPMSYPFITSTTITLFLLPNTYHTLHTHQQGSIHNTYILYYLFHNNSALMS